MNDKERLRVARDILAALLKLRQGRYQERLAELGVLVRRLQEVVRDWRRLSLALERNWLAAAERCCRSACRELDGLPYTISRAQTLLNRPEKDVPTLSEMVAELKAVEAQFGDLQLDSEDYVLSVDTEPIILEDVYLGPFRIALYLGRLRELYQRPPYYIEALEPHPAATDDAITHPHVNNEVLCEGDGLVAVRAALAEGRLFDFFEMVGSILNTYNPDSPFVPLADWDGVPCYECGYIMDSEHSYYCTCCDNAVCDECSTVCAGCSETVCRTCGGLCEICERSLCPKCAKQKCSECESVCCESCLDEGLCPECREERQSNEEQETEDKQEAPAGQEAAAMGGRLVDGGQRAGGPYAAVQPHGVGQAAVLPGPVRQ